MADYKGKWLNFSGKGYWVKIGSKTDDAFDPQWNLRLDMNEDSLKRFKASGIQKELRDPTTGKIDPDGTAVQFSRRVLKIFKGTPVYFTPPKVYNKDRSIMTEYIDKETSAVITNTEKKDGYERRGPEPIIGNGSEIEVNVYVYPTKKGFGSQLDGVRIIDLIEYVPENKPEEEAKPAPEPEVKKKGKAPW